MSHAEARKAIEAKLVPWAEAEAVPLLFSTDAADQPGDVYLRAFLLPGSTTTPYLGGDSNVYTGVYQISVICLGATPLGVAEGILAKLALLFPVDSDLVTLKFNGAVIEPLSQGPTIEEDDRYNVPISLSYWGLDE